jgi:hypothetical protein
MKSKKDVLIHIKIEHLSTFDFKNYKELTQIGEESTCSMLPELKKNKA